MQETSDDPQVDIRAVGRGSDHYLWHPPFPSAPTPVYGPPHSPSNLPTIAFQPQPALRPFNLNSNF